MQTSVLPTLVIAATLLTGCVSSEQQGARHGTDPSSDGRAIVASAENCGDEALDPQFRIDGCTVLIETQDDPALLATAYNNRGGAYTDLGQYREARRDLDEALALDPSMAPAYVNRGWAFYGLDQNRRAIADFDQAISLDPDRVSAHFYRGMAHAALEEYGVALASYDRAIELDPAHAGAFMRRAMARHDLGQYEVAIADFDRAADLNPTYEEIYQFRGYSKCRLRREAQAYDDWMQADRTGDTDRRRTYQRLATEFGYYDGPLNGEATPEWHSAIAEWARGQCS